MTFTKDLTTDELITLINNTALDANYFRSLQQAFVKNNQAHRELQRRANNRDLQV